MFKLGWWLVIEREFIGLGFLLQVFFIFFRLFLLWDHLLGHLWHHLLDRLLDRLLFFLF